MNITLDFASLLDAEIQSLRAFLDFVALWWRPGRLEPMAHQLACWCSDLVDLLTQGNRYGDGRNLGALRLAGGRHVVPQSRRQQRSGQFAVSLRPGGRVRSAGPARAPLHAHQFRPDRCHRQRHPTLARHHPTIQKWVSLAYFIIKIKFIFKKN